jgi:hypothetical protein
MLPFPSRSSNKSLFKELINDGKIDIKESKKNYRIRRSKKLRRLLKESSKEEKNNHIISALETEGLVDLTIDRNVRRKKRKAYANRPDHLRQVDPVNITDLEIVCDYDEYFVKCIDPKITLNTKGPLANLWFGFKVNRLINFFYLLINL